MGLSYNLSQLGIESCENGDIVAYDGTQDKFIRVPAGAPGTTLVADPGNAGGVNWGGAGPGGGSVTDVGLLLPADVFNITVSPVVLSGVLTATFKDQVKNTVWAGPSAGVNAGPTFRALSPADIPFSPSSAHVSVAALLTDTLTLLESQVYCNTDSTFAIELTLPVAGSCDGKTYFIKKVGTDATATVTILPDGAELIDGAASFLLYAPGDYVIASCDGTGWQTFGSKQTP
jgi:hypothetical protein